MALMRSGLSGWLGPGWCCRNIGCEIHTVRAFFAKQTAQASTDAPKDFFEHGTVCVGQVVKTAKYG